MKSDTRAKIVHTASELFYRNGYNLTGINEIIDKSGIAKATLYNHFKTKEDILLAYLDYNDDNLMTNIKAFTSSKSKGNKRLVAILEFLIPFYNKHNFNGCWCIRSIAEVPKENQKIRQKIKQSKMRFHDFINTLVKENKPKLKPNKQKQLSDKLYLLYEGAITESHILESDWPIRTSISLFQDILKSK